MDFLQSYQWALLKVVFKGMYNAQYYDKESIVISSSSLHFGFLACLYAGALSSSWIRTLMLKVGTSGKKNSGYYFTVQIGLDENR